MFVAWKIFDPKFFLDQIFLGPENVWPGFCGGPNFLGPEVFVAWKICSPQFVGPENWPGNLSAEFFLARKFFCLESFVDWQVLCAGNLLSHNFLAQNVLARNYFGPEIFVPKIIWSGIFWGPEIFWPGKFFGSKFCLWLGKFLARTLVGLEKRAGCGTF